MALCRGVTNIIFKSGFQGLALRYQSAVAMPDACKIQLGKVPRKKPIPLRKRMLNVTFQKLVASNYIALIFQRNGISGQEMENLRYDLEQHEIHIRVFPKTLFIKGVERTNYKNIVTLLGGHCALVYSNNTDLNPLIKITKKLSDKFSMVGGKVDNMLLTAPQVVAFSSLPSLEEQRAELISLIASPLTQLSASLQHHQTRTVQLLDSHNQEKEN